MKSKLPSSIWEGQTVADALRRNLEVYSPQSLASRLGISPGAVRRAIKSGKLKAHRVNSRVFHIESPEAARWWISLAE
jgi:hypothetical protein